MSLSIGIVGLPNVGKSTLFNALTKSTILAANYPFATIEPNVGIVGVPDGRLARLAEMYETEKIIPASVTFVDIAGLVSGASKGEGLGNKFLANIRECQAVCHVVRAFQDDNVVHVANRIHPKEDIEIINTELILADLQTLENAMVRIQKEAKSNPSAKSKLQYFERLKEHLEAGTTLSSLPSLDEEMLIGLSLLTSKPVIYVFNVDEDTLSNQEKQQELANIVGGQQSIFICAKVEEELRDLEEDDAKELLAEYGQDEPGLNKLIKAAYSTLGLQSYLTAGKKEVRAWTIKKGYTAPQAAGVIHGDFERGFIAAQIVDYDDLMSAGSMSEAKNNGKLRTEGKEYIMQPGDVVEFRFNV